MVSSLFGMMAVGTQIIKSNLLQLGQELEEASRTAGGTWVQTFRRVLMPILSPVLLVVAILTFVSAARDISNMVPLATPATRPFLSSCSIFWPSIATKGQPRSLVLLPL